MALNNYLTLEKFLASSNGLTSADINISYVEMIIERLNQTLEKKLGVATGQVRKYHRKNSSRVVLVESWQRRSLLSDPVEDLVIKRGIDGSDGLRTLIEGSDYRLKFSSLDDSANIVVAVILYSQNLNSPRDYIQLEGDKGLFSEIPDNLTTLDLELYELIKQAVFYSDNQNLSGGRGDIQSTRMADVSLTFGSGQSGSSKNLTVQGIIDSVEARLNGIYEDYTQFQNYSLSIIND